MARKPGVCQDCGEPTSRTSRTICGVCRAKRMKGDASSAPAAPKPPQFGDDIGRDVVLERERSDKDRFKKLYSQTVKERADEERVIDLFDRSIRRFPALPAGAFRLPSAKAHPAPTPEVPCLIIGDQQIGEEIAIEETFGINSYNFGVYQARLEQLEDRVVDILTHHQRAPFSELVVLSMGDNVSGLIHDELQKYGNQHVIDQVYLGALTAALFLWRLLARLRSRGIQRIRVSGVSGNHGRVTQQKESKRYYKNFDYLFHSIMATTLRDVPEIEFHIPKCLFTVVDIAGHRILQSHGHEMPPSSLGIPLYSINRASASYQELLSWTEARRFDYWVLAHFHRPMELDGSIVNGTMAGLGEFGIGKFKPIRPMQKLLGFHEKWGKAWEYPIRLDKASDAAKVYTFDPAMAPTDAIDLFQTRRREQTA
jgi:hypothetical protein